MYIYKCTLTGAAHKVSVYYLCCLCCSLYGSSVSSTSISKQPFNATNPAISCSLSADNGPSLCVYHKQAIFEHATLGAQQQGLSLRSLVSVSLAWVTYYEAIKHCGVHLGLASVTCKILGRIVTATALEIFSHFSGYNHFHGAQTAFGGLAKAIVLG